MGRERKTLWLIVGAALGALFGLGVAHALWQQYEERGSLPRVDGKRGLRLLLTLLQAWRKIIAQLEAE